MWEDPIVEEVRKHRREIEEECNGDFSVISFKAKELEKKLKDRLVSKVPLKRAKRKTEKTA